MKKSNLFLIIILSALLLNCSSSKSSTGNGDKNKQQIYVFDDVTNLDSVQINQDTLVTENITQPVEMEKDSVHITQPAEEIVDTSDTIPKTVKYIIQLGAFSSKGRAQLYIDQNKDKISLEMQVSENKTTNLFHVQLPPYLNREDADKTLQSLKNIQTFKDAFIVTVEK